MVKVLLAQGVAFPGSVCKGYRLVLCVPKVSRLGLCPPQPVGTQISGFSDCALRVMCDSSSSDREAYEYEGSGPKYSDDSSDGEFTQDVNSEDGLTPKPYGVILRLKEKSAKVLQKLESLKYSTNEIVETQLEEKSVKALQKLESLKYLTNETVETQVETPLGSANYILRASVGDNSIGDTGGTEDADIKGTTNPYGLADIVGGPAFASDVLKRLVEMLNMSAQPRLLVQTTMRIGTTNFIGTAYLVEELFWLSKTRMVLEEGMDCFDEENVKIVEFLFGGDSR
ncbi:hypothetical protein FNV43_RR24609 [Rhamnella rubrinervis]|uniref:Uncharacterized protein n=1 Tax=Rhamnella rubrinervis TaxID=2594499 RepID=A0A8K0DYF0_9ROSA|nr:hypothetical protein FNV43_RR24609 [Rhamnella rubrinervis]